MSVHQPRRDQTTDLVAFHNDYALEELGSVVILVPDTDDEVGQEWIACEDDDLLEDPDGMWVHGGDV